MAVSSLTPTSGWGPSELFLQNADGTFAPLGEADITAGELQLSENDSPRWWTDGDGPGPVEFTCELKGRPVNLQQVFDQEMLRQITDFIRAFRRIGYRGRFHIELRKREYLLLRGASRRLCAMNPTRYVRSVIPSAPAKLFRVMLPSGSWVWCK